MTKSIEDIERLYELVCAGRSIQVSAEVVGVSRTRATFFWRRSAPMGLEITMGRVGGVEGTPPPDPLGQSRRGGSARSRRPLTSEDRAVIAAGVRQRLSYQQIGELVGRTRSVIWREVARNSGPDGSYWAPLAHRVAHEHRRRPKGFKLAEQPSLCRRIEEWMDQGWSPKLIASVLATDHPPGSPRARGRCLLKFWCRLREQELSGRSRDPFAEPMSLGSHRL